jgi:aryl-alcohol dehydrogenase-like predicted oxidoreductase
VCITFLRSNHAPHTPAQEQARVLHRCRIEINTYSKSKYTSVMERAGGSAWFQSLLLVLKDIAQKNGTSISNVACRWVLDKPLVAGIIVGARNASHVAEHAALASIKLDDQDYARIKSVLDVGTAAHGDVYTWERGGVW